MLMTCVAPDSDSIKALLYTRRMMTCVTSSVRKRASRSRDGIGNPLQHRIGTQQHRIGTHLSTRVAGPLARAKGVLWFFSLALMHRICDAQTCSAGTFGVWPSCPNCAANTYSPAGATACTACPANSWSAAGAGNCTANPGFFGPTLYMFDGINPSYANMGSDSSHVISNVNYNPTYSTVGSKYGAYFNSAVNSNYLTVSNKYNTVSLSFWMYFTGTYTTTASYQFGMFGLVSSDLSSIGFNIQIGYNSGSGYGWFWANYGAFQSAVCPVGSFPSNVWLHVVLVAPEGSNRQQRIYLNGVRAGISSSTGSSDIANYQMLSVGAYPTESKYYQGYLSNVAMYNYAMSDADVTTLYSSGTTPTPFIACSTTSIICTGGTVRCTPNGTTVCCGGGQYFVEGVSVACQTCPAGTYGAGNATVCTNCPSGRYSPSGASACSQCAAGTFSANQGQAANSTPAAFSWLLKNPSNGKYYTQFPTFASSQFYGSTSETAFMVYFSAYSFSTTLQANLVSVTLATSSSSGTCSSSSTDLTYAYICSTDGTWLDLGNALECNAAPSYAIINTTGTPFGIQSSAFYACAGSPHGVTTSCTSSTYCTARGASNNGNCGSTGYTGALTIINATLFNADIVQACALYKTGTGLTCTGSETVRYVASSPCLSCASTTGAYSIAGSSSCTLCGAGNYVPSGASSCVACPVNTVSYTSVGDTSGPNYSPPSAQFSASSYNDGLPFASSAYASYALNSGGMWLASSSEYPFQNSWLQFDLLTALPVKAVVTQGGSSSAYVTSILVGVSTNGVSFINVTSRLTANSDGTTVVVNPISPMVYARYVRIYVLSFYKQPGMRAGVQLGQSGCFCAAGYYQNPQYNASGIFECSQCSGTCAGTTKHCSPTGTLVCCGAGQYFVDGVSTACQTCAGGTYGFGNTTACASCPANSFSSAGASACTVCPANTGSVAGSNGCVPVTGYYDASSSTRFPPSPYMSGATCTVASESFTASASSAQSNEPAWGAFNNVLCSTTANSDWTSGSAAYSSGVYSGSYSTVVDGVTLNGEWLQLQFGTPRQLGSYNFTAASYCPARAPSKFVIAGSNSGSGPWITVDSQTSTFSYGVESINTFYVAKVTGLTFTYFRLIILSAGTGSCPGASGGTYDGYISIDEWSLYTGSLATCTTSGCTAPNPNGQCSTTGTLICCPNGAYWVPSATNAGCTPCPLGSYASSATTVCTSCAAGTYAAATGSSVCTACASGTNSLAGSSSCPLSGPTTASAGQYLVNGVVYSCGAGTYSSGSGMTTASTCTNCTAGTYSMGTGMTSNLTCTACNPGTFSSGIGMPIVGTCSSCGAGTYSSGSGMTTPNTCTNCTSGTYSMGTGMTSNSTCSNCTAGSYSSGTGMTTASTCTNCSGGAYSSGSGMTTSSTCSSCGAGTYSSGSGMTAISTCTNCTAGTYSIGTGMTTSSTCSNCTSGSYSSGIGMTTISTCTNCSAGAYSSGVGMTTASTCSNCTSGSYSSGIGMTTASTCSNCTSGSYSSGIGMTTISTCTNCTSGSYSSGVGMTTVSTCSNCTYGTYSSGVGMTTSSTCSSCNAGTYSSGSGITTSLACSSCSAGTYSQSAGLSTCGACTPSVSFSVSASSTACSLCGTCSVGKYVNTACNITANVTCAQCPAGTYGTLSSGCVPCPPNTFSAAPGAVMCQGCPANTWSAAQSTACTPNPGYFYNTTTSSYTTCSPPSCSSPTPFGHCSVSGAGVCCGNGTFFVDGVSSACQACPGGTYGFGNASACTLCSAGTYSAGGVSSCTPCPANTGSVAGASTFTPNTGYYVNGGGSVVTCTPASCSAVAPVTYSQCTTPSGTAVCCGNGTYWVPSSSSSGCTPCPAGTYGFGNSTVCTPCSSGSFSASAGSSICSLCTGGSTSLPGSTSCVPPASAGSYFSITANATVGCPSGGFFCTGGAAQPQTCAVCTSGSYTQTNCSASTNTVCAICPAGKYCSNPASNVPVSCGTSQYCPAGSTQYATCSAGFYCPNATVQLACSTAGTLCLAGSTAPVPCPSSYYCPTSANEIQCTSTSYCPASSTAQNPCPATYFCPNTSTKVLCNAGTYCPAGATASVPCATGSYCPTTSTQIACNLTDYCAGSNTAQSLCPAGSYCANPSSISPCTVTTYCPAGSITPQACPPAFYCSSPSTIAACPVNNFCLVNVSSPTPCTVCAAGNYTSSFCTASANAVCTGCLAGTNYASTANASTCTTCGTCASGQYIVTACNTTANVTCAICPLGSYCPDPTTSNVVACAPGQYCVAGSTAPAPCPAGLYCPNASAKIACPANSYCLSGSSAPTNCSVCNPGYYRSVNCSATANTVCPACSAGSTFTNTSNAAQCSSCNTCPGQHVGTACTASSDAVCSACAAGNYCPSSSLVIPCIQGQYCPAGSTAPSQCAAGYVCSIDTTTQTPCTLGNYCPQNTTTAVQCLVGYFCPNTSSQILCTSGNYCPTGSTNQTICAAGSVCASPTQQVACNPGSYCPNGTTVPQNCPVGYVCATPATKVACVQPNYCPLNSTSQIPCAAGNFCPNTTVQLACPANSYCSQGVTAPSTCSVCSNGQYIASACNSSNNIVCRGCTDLVSNAAYTGVGSAIGNCPWVCNSAYYLNSSQCSACPANSWCNGNVLNACPNNALSYPLSYVQNQCLCAPGYFGNGSVSGTSPCHLCNAGFYCPGGNNNLTFACPQNFSSPVGSYSYSSCQCIPGYLRTGNYTCTLCAPGQICISGQLSACPPNSLAPPGSSSASACVCNPGFYGPNGGPCVQCPPNSFCPGGNVITACTAHAISPAQSVSANACYCDRGYQGVNDAVCNGCPSNTWCWTGILNTCPSNTSAPALSSYPTNCTCLPGFTGADGTACSPCQPGTYKTANGSSSCAVCPANSYCPQGSVTATACPLANSNSPSGSISVSQCQCNAGYYGSLCTQCPVASYCPGGSASYACPNNGYTIAGASSASQCTCPANSAVNSSGICACVAGYQHIVDGTAPGGWRCGVCPANSYCMGNDMLAPCPSGSTSAAQSTNPLNCICAQPTYLYEISNTTFSCINCPANQYYSSNTQCGTCPANSTSPPGTASPSGCTCVNSTYVVSNPLAPSGLQCNACPPGLFCNGGTSSPCPANYYCVGNNINPVACPALSTSPMYSNASSACLCPNGYYMSNGVCVKCGYGTYSSMGAVGACTSCPANSNTSTTGANLLTNCLCTAGYTGDTTAPGANNPLNSLISYYAFNPQAFLVDSSSSNGISLIASSSPPVYSPSTPFTSCGGSAAMNLNAVTTMNTGSNQFFTLPSYNFGTYSSGFSICLWFQPNSLAPNWESVFLFGAGTKTTNIYLQRDGTSTGWQLSTYTNGAWSPIIEFYVNAGQWAHVCAVYDPTYFYGYLNGSLISKFSQSTWPNQVLNQNTIVNTNWWPSYPAFSGNIAEFRVYSTGLSALNVANLYAWSPCGCDMCPSNSFCPGGKANYTVQCPNSTYSVIGSSSVGQCVCPPASSWLPKLNCTCNNGTYQVANSALPLAGWQCNTCVSGNYCQLGNSIACPAGSYCPSSVSAPVPCPPGSYCLASSSAPVTCAPGSFCINGFSNVCPVHYYCPSGASAPTPCPAGLFCLAQSAAPSSCPTGSFCVNGTVVTCPVGFYCPANAPSPIACPAGLLCVAQSTAPAACPTGSYCQNGIATPCPSTFYCPANASSPIACPPGSFCLSSSVAPTSCSGGYFCQNGTSNPCPVQFYCPAGTASAIACPSGTVCPPLSSSPGSCASGSYCQNGISIPCPAGSFCAAGVSAPTQCPQGWYCGASVSAATQCQANSNTPATGATSASQCTCNPGFTGTGSCSVCLANYYCPGGAQEVRCPVGMYSVAGSSSLSQCGCPSNSSLIGSTCICNAGLLQVTNAADPLGGWECDACPANSVCVNGTSSLCAAGSFCVAGNAKVCPANTYCVAGSTAAISCPTYSTSPAGSSACTCANGYIMKACPSCVPPQTSTCAQCPVNMYCMGGNMYSCPAGSTSPLGSQSQASCVCQPGFYSSQGACVACPGGSFCPGGSVMSNTAISACPAGSFCPPSSSAPIPCASQPGSFCPASSSAIGACPAGYFCTTPIGPPTACPIGTYCAQNSTAPTTCPANTFSSYIEQTSVSACAPCTICTSGSYQISPCQSTADRVCQGCTGAPPHASFLTSSTTCQWICNDGYAGPTCSPCPAGSWCAQGVSNQCPLNSASPPGASSQDSCICNPGYITETGGTSPCVLCSAGVICPGGATVVVTVSPVPQPNVSVQLVLIEKPLPPANNLVSLFQGIPNYVATIQSTLPTNTTVYTRQVCRSGYCVSCDGSPTCVQRVWVGVSQNALGQYAYNVTSVPADALITFVVVTAGLCTPTINLQSEYVTGLLVAVSSISSVTSIPVVCTSNLRVGTTLPVTGTTPALGRRLLENSRRLLQISNDAVGVTAVATATLLPHVQAAVAKANLTIKGYSPVQGQTLTPPSSSTNASSNTSSSAVSAPTVLSCPANSTSPLGATSISQCVCLPGYEGNAAANTPCTPCGPNEYCSGGKLGFCPSNSNAPAESSLQSECQCNPGFYGPPTACTQCPANAYCPGGTAIIQCTANALSPAGSTSPSACYCSPGFSGTADTQCQPCTHGNWCLTGISNQCPLDKTSNASASSVNQCFCIDGYGAVNTKDSNGNPVSVCVLCAANSYCKVRAYPHSVYNALHSMHAHAFQMSIVPFSCMQFFTLGARRKLPTRPIFK